LGTPEELFKRQFGSDLLAGISTLTAIALREYLVATIVVLMLSGGEALEEYATAKASSDWMRWRGACETWHIAKKRTD
jgi:cation transport ATPase